MHNPKLAKNTLLNLPYPPRALPTHTREPRKIRNLYACNSSALKPEHKTIETFTRAPSNPPPDRSNPPQIPETSRHPEIPYNTPPQSSLKPEYPKIGETPFKDPHPQTPPLAPIIHSRTSPNPKTLHTTPMIHLKKIKIAKTPHPVPEHLPTPSPRL